jgi:ABC-2 type transport system permease protein
MTNSIVRQLVWKDWQIHRLQILLSMLGGAAGLAVMAHGGEVSVVVGSVLLLVALVVVGSMLPSSAIVNERKKQNLAFVMSLPVSVRQYTVAKLLATVGMFLVPWLILVGAALLLIEVRGMVPHGAIPITLVLLLLPFVGFCVITGCALVGESERWSVAATVFCNSTYGLTWYFIARVPSLMEEARSAAPVWSSQDLTLLGAEVGVIALILALTFYLQSRKRDFI